MAHVLNLKRLEQSYKARPRKGIVVYGCISMVFAVICTAALVCAYFFPQVYQQSFLQSVKFTFLEKETTLADFLPLIGVQAASFVLFIFPYSCCGIMSHYRGLYIFLRVLGVLFGIAFLLLAILTGFYTAKDLIGETYYGYATEIAKFFMPGVGLFYIIVSLLAILYNHTHPLAYSDIYRQRKKAIQAAKEKGDKELVKTIKKNFYLYYKQKDFESLLLLLYSNVIDSNDEIGEGELQYILVHLSKVENEIRTKEFVQLIEKGDFMMIRKIFKMERDFLARVDCAETRIKNDAVLISAYERSLASAPAAPQIAAAPAAKETKPEAPKEEKPEIRPESKDPFAKDKNL